MRKENSIKNISFVLVGQVANLIIGFITRKIFVLFLAREYLDLNGLFTNVISVLSLAELGMGSAMVFSLYEPLAKRDTQKIQALMGFYSKAYKLIALVVLTAGIAIYPFLDIFMGAEKPQNIANVNRFYFLYLANSVISYLWAYKRSLILADQKNFILVLYKQVLFFALNVVQVLLLIFTGSFLFYMIAQVLNTVVENLLVSRKADQMYPYIRHRQGISLDRESKHSIFKNLRALVYHKVGDVMISSTDNILISMLVGMSWVGLYNNYYMVLGALNTIIAQIFNSITATVGNLSVSEGEDQSYCVFKRILFANFWMMAFCTITLLVEIQPFVDLWLGQAFWLPTATIIILGIKFYLTGLRKTVLMFRDAMGLFWYDRYKPIAEVILNLVASILLAKPFGISGVFAGTVVSTLLTSFWIEPYILYRRGFPSKPLRHYFYRVICYTGITVLLALLTWGICSFLPGNGILGIAVRLLICVLVPNGVLAICFHRTDAFQYYWSIAKGIGSTVWEKCHHSQG